MGQRHKPPGTSEGGHFMEAEFSEGTADLSAGVTDDLPDDVTDEPGEKNAEDRAIEKYADQYVEQHGPLGHHDDPPIDPGLNDYFGRPPVTDSPPSQLNVEQVAPTRGQPDR